MDFGFTDNLPVSIVEIINEWLIQLKENDLAVSA